MSEPPYDEAHERACALGEHGYADPASGRFVFTRIGLLARGRCCGSRCRHCPYNHEAVITPVDRRR